jgi:hypothetical protein
MKRERFVSVFLMSMFLISFASALSVTSTSESNVIIPDFNQAAEFKLTITGANPGSYNMYTLTDVNLKPASPFMLTSGSNEVDIFVFSTDQLKERGFYSFSYTLKKMDGESFEEKLTVKVVDLEDAIEINSGSNDPVTGKINFHVKNKEKAVLKGVNAKFSSVFFDFEQTFDLGAFEQKEFEVDVGEDELSKIAAGSYIVKAEFDTDKGLKEIEGRVFLGEKKGVDTQEDISGFLIYTKTVNKINSGNVEETVSVSMSKDAISRLFTSFNVEPNVVDRQGFKVFYTWHKSLGPAEIFSVKAKTNYIYPLLIVIVAALLIMGFKRYTEMKVDVSKSVNHVKTKTGHFALRVKINVKAKKAVENVSLIDKVPAIVKVYEKFGTEKPTKIDAANRRIQWDIGDLNAGEERIFSYVVYSKVGVVGKFALPEALVVFEKEGEIHETESNKVFFLSEQVKKDED